MPYLSKIISLFFLIFFMSSNSFSKDINTPIISSISFNSINFQIIIYRRDYTSFLENMFLVNRNILLLLQLKKKKIFVNKCCSLKISTISGSIINDEVLDRKIDDFSSIRKDKDDSFDAVAEIRQPIYTGVK